MQVREKCSLAESLASLNASARAAAIAELDDEQAASLLHDWRFWARPEQLAPGSVGASALRSDWTYWLLNAGRGFGKTRCGGEWVREVGEDQNAIIHLVGATLADVRDVMVQGESGLLSCYPETRRPLYEPSKRLVTFPSGATAHTFSADEPERLRGPQCLIGETLVTMADGSRLAIQHIRRGDRVQTRFGPRTVLKSVRTSTHADLFRLRLADGRSIIGTADHPVSVGGIGFVSLAKLKIGQQCAISASNGTAEGGIFSRTATTKSRSGYIGKYGGPRTDQFPKGSTFITKTKTRSTTASTIWNSYRSQNTPRCIPATLQHIASSPLRPLLSRAQRSGLSGCYANSPASSAAPSITVEPRLHRDTAPSVAWSGLDQNRSRLRSASANTVASSMRLQRGFSASAQSGVTQELLRSAQDKDNPERSPVTAGPPLSALEATHDSAVENAPYLSMQAVVSVEALSLCGSVYDITVEGAHEFFANGILVHNCTHFWADELAAWRYPEAWDNLLFGFRLGNRPQGVITTTPKPVKLIRDLIKDPATVVTRGTSYENRLNLAPAFYATIIKKYEGTRLGRQELLAELLEDIPGALWTRAMVEAARVTAAQVPPYMVRVVVAVDPAVSANDESDETGICVVGLAETGHCYVFRDLTMRDTPLTWAKAVIAAYKHHSADRVVAEVNNGGDLVARNIWAVDSTIPFRAVHASRGKAVRAEPVAGLYEQGRVHHVGPLEYLEDQMCSWVAGSGEKSPDRMDALVWAITDLVLEQEMVEEVHTYDSGYRISPV